MSTGKAGLILRQMGQVIPTLVGIVVLTFLMTRVVPSDPAAYFSGPSADAELVAQVRRHLGLDHSLGLQFILYLAQLVHGDLGQSISSGQPVVKELLARLPASLELVLTAVALSVSIVIPLSVRAASRPGTWSDRICRLLTAAGANVPTFLIGIVLILLFCVLLDWAPEPTGRLDDDYFAPPYATGFFTLDALLAGELDTARAAAAQLLLPAMTLGLFLLAPLAGTMRDAMRRALASNFVRTARAAGLSGRRLTYTYAFRNALVPTIASLGTVCSLALAGAVLVEKVFAWPGVGTYTIDAVAASDYAVVQGVVLATSVLLIALKLVVDIAVTLLSSRVGVER